MQKHVPTSPVDKLEARRGRGRPRAFDRDAALARAMVLFWRKGFEATSIADLTQAMGIGSPSLYAAFGSKEALYIEALRHYRATYDQRGLNSLRSDMPAREAIERYLMGAAAALAGDIDHPAGCMVTLASVCADEHRDLHDLMRTERQVSFDLLKQRLCKAVEEGEIPASVDAHALARYVQTVIFGISVLARDGGSRHDLEAAARIALEGWDAHVSAAGKG
jgi:AcrR family transcriptional regulator